MCYTNHALDSFLEDMLDKGIQDIVRIGGGSKNPKLDPYQLRSRQASGFDRVQNRQFAHLKGALEESQQSIDDVLRTSKLNSKPEKMAVVAWLEDGDPEAFQELQMPEGLGGAGDTVVGKKVGGEGGEGVAGNTTACHVRFVCAVLTTTMFSEEAREGRLGQVYRWVNRRLLYVNFVSYSGPPSFGQANDAFVEE